MFERVKSDLYMRRVRIRMRRPTKKGVFRALLMYERDAWLETDLKWNHMAIAEEGGRMPNPPTGV